LYPLQIPVGPLKAHGALWCVGKRTLLLTVRGDLASTFEELKKSLPLKPRRGNEGLRPALRDCLEKRLPRGTWAWVAGTSLRAATAAGLGASAQGVAAVAGLATIRPEEQGPEARRQVHFQMQAAPGRLREALQSGQRLFPGLRQ